MLTDKYHLPHNAIRIDEFNFMLNSVDLNKDYYFYRDLRMLFLKKQIESNTLKIYHRKYNSNLLNHKDSNVRMIYQSCIDNPNDENLEKLLSCQYTEAKTFKQVFNETVRDYTEFFAFLGLLPTYYKGKSGGEKKHFVTARLIDYRNKKISLEDLLLDFKFRNSSKDYDSLTMYQISLRPFVVALKVLQHYFDAGFTKIHSTILSAIVLYSKSENIDAFYSIFNDPTKEISDYKSNFPLESFSAIHKELIRATLFLRPYLIEMKYVNRVGKFYVKGDKKIENANYCERVAFCNSNIGLLTLTPVVGKLLFTLYEYSKKNISILNISDFFDSNVSRDDKNFLIDQLQTLGCIEKSDDLSIKVLEKKKQISVNPYSDFFDYEESKYVQSVINLNIYSESQSFFARNVSFENEMNLIRPIALGSDGEKYEKALYNLLKNYFNLFNVKWLGANATGQRLSDLYLKVNILDGTIKKTIAIIVECKAGKAIKAFDERKEVDDVLNSLAKESQQIDGVWYWVVDGDSLPSVDDHGGYRDNALSKSFIEKLNVIQFSISESMRIPTIVTAFSFDAINNYLCYLYDKIGNIHPNINSLNRLNVPHFWRWSKKFMNLQYVIVHKELSLGA